MARRPSFDEPMSRLAAWSGRLALFALAVAVLSILIVRANVLEIEPALATFGAALALAGLAVLLALLSFVSIWRHGRPGLGRAAGGLLLGLTLLAYPAYLGYRASKLPALTDITTDTDNPPRFIALAKQRPPGRRAPRGRHRTGGAHADHGLPRRRGDPRRALRGRRAHRRAVGLALRHAR